MPTNFSDEFQSIDLENAETQTISVDNTTSKEEKFNAGKWMLAVTSIINTHVDKISKLERQIKFLSFVVSILVAWEIYRVL